MDHPAAVANRWVLFPVLCQCCASVVAAVHVVVFHSVPLAGGDNDNLFCFLCLIEMIVGASSNLFWQLQSFINILLIVYPPE